MKKGAKILNLINEGEFSVLRVLEEGPDHGNRIYITEEKRETTMLARGVRFYGPNRLTQAKEFLAGDLTLKYLLLSH